jgi:alpha-tubulin suppressor-like RCC1 family protein
MSCALDLDGDVHCTGYAVDVPEPFVGPWMKISAGSQVLCVVDLDGYLECRGQPVDWVLPWPDGQFEQVDAGRSVSCAIGAGHRMTCWGVDDGEHEDFGQVSDAPTEDIAQVSCGWNFGCAVDVDGAAHCWGSNGEGQALAPEGRFVQLDSGWAHACGVRIDGSLACWGLDDPTNDRDGGQVRDTPTTGTWLQVSAGYSHTCAVRSDEKVVCWGRNESGQCDVPDEFAP